MKCKIQNAPKKGNGLTEPYFHGRTISDLRHNFVISSIPIRILQILSFTIFISAIISPCLTFAATENQSNDSTNLVQGIMSNIREDTAALITAIESIVSEIVARMTDRAASSQRLAFMSQNSPSPATIGTTTGNSDENTVASVTPQPSLALQRKSGQAAWDIVSQATKGTVRIIVEVKPATTPGYATLGTAHENMPAILSDNLAVEDAVITAHFGSPASSIESSKSLVHTDVLPYFGITATLPEIESLASDDRVVSIDL